MSLKKSIDARKAKEEPPPVEDEDDSQAPKKGWFGGWGKDTPKNGIVVKKVTTEKEIGVPNTDTMFLVGEDGRAQVIKGNYYPHDEEFMIAEKERPKEEGGAIWILYRKQFNKKTGEDEVVEHFKVNLKQLSRVVMMTQSWDDDEPEESIINKGTEGARTEGSF